MSAAAWVITAVTVAAVTVTAGIVLRNRRRTARFTQVIQAGDDLAAVLGKQFRDWTDDQPWTDEQWDDWDAELSRYFPDGEQR